MSRLFGVPLDFSSSTLATPPNIMESQDGGWPKPEPVVNDAVDDPFSKLCHDIDLAQRNQVQFGNYFGNFNVDAYASTVNSEGGGEGGYVTQHPQNDKNERGNLAESMRRLQDSHLRVTKRIYGLQAARIQAKSMGRNSGEIRFSAGELVVAVVRSVRNNQVWVELLISRNDRTSIASLEAFSLGLSDMTWRQNLIAPSGTPLETLRAYLAYKESMAQEGIIVNSVLIDAASINGFRQSAKCFCNEAFTIEYAAHGPVHCSLHQVATSVVVRLREIVTPNAMLGQLLVLRDVPPIHHSIFKSGGEIDRASLNQWPIHPHTAPTPKKKLKKVRAKKGRLSDVVVQKKNAKSSAQMIKYI